MYKICIVTLLACLSYHTGLGQKKGSPSKDSLVLENGTILYVGDTLQLGKVSENDDKFQYIYRPAGGFIYLPKMRLDKEFEGGDAIIRSFRSVYVSRSKSKMVAVIYNKDFGSKDVDIHLALESGEIAAVRKKATGQEGR